MIEELPKQPEELIGSDDFEFASEEITEKPKKEGAGFEIIERLLSLMEDHPIDDFGSPGAVTHFIERFYPEYLPLLISSVKRRPAIHTLWMINRCLNSGKNKEELLSALETAANDVAADELIRETAKTYIYYHSAK